METRREHKHILRLNFLVTYHKLKHARLAPTWPQINKVSLITSSTLKTAHPLLTL